jgi:hypothetical protein
VIDTDPDQIGLVTREIDARVMDRAGNPSGIIHAYTMLDTYPPFKPTITAPSAFGFTTIQGTAYDQWTPAGSPIKGGSGIGKVKVKLRKTVGTDNYYWDGTTWGTIPNYYTPATAPTLDATVTPETADPDTYDWRVNNLPVFSVGDIIDIVATAYDKAGNPSPDSDHVSVTISNTATNTFSAGNHLISIPYNNPYKTLADIIGSMNNLTDITQPNNLGGNRYTAPGKVKSITRFNSASQDYENVYWSPGSSQWEATFDNPATDTLEAPAMVAGEGVEINLINNLTNWNPRQ